MMMTAEDLDTWKLTFTDHVPDPLINYLTASFVLLKSTVRVKGLTDVNRFVRLWMHYGIQELRPHMSYCFVIFRMTVHFIVFTITDFLLYPDDTMIKKTSTSGTGNLLDK
jgi:hypothetical protein